MKSRKRTKSRMVRRTIYIKGHKTSVSLEDQFWEPLKEIATERRSTVHDLVASIKAERRQGNLSSTIRVLVLEHYQAQLTGRTPSAKKKSPGQSP